MSYSTVADYRDKLLAEFVTEGYIADADADINDLALSLMVPVDKIPSPAPNIVKKLSIARTYRDVARDQSRMNSGESGNEKDPYEMKRVYWESEVERLESLITPAALTGGRDGVGGGLSTKTSFPCSIPLRRS